MTDLKLLCSAFALLSQPVILVKKMLIAYMNPAAVKLTASDMTGKPAELLFPSYIMNTQADSFVSSAFIGSKSCAVKVSTAEGYKIYALEPIDCDVDSNALFFTGMRSNLANIRVSATCISVLAEKEQNTELLTYASTLSRSYYKISRAVENMATLYALANKDIPFIPEPLDVTELCRSIFDTVSTLAGSKALKINFNAEEHVRINADRKLIEQLLLNLLSNCITHSRENGRISVSLLRGDKYLIISFDDDGDGISPEELSMVFDRYRHGIDLSNPNTGAGLGLAIVRGIAELHGGTVIIESRGKSCGTSVRAMLSYSTEASDKFRAPASVCDSELMSRILTELSPCLPDDCYSGILND